MKARNCEVADQVWPVSFMGQDLSWKLAEARQTAGPFYPRLLRLYFGNVA